MIVHGFHCHKGFCGPVGLTLLNVPNGLEPMNARQRRM